MRALRPQPIAISFVETAGASAALTRRSLRYFPGHQPAHAGDRIEFRVAAHTSVDNDANAGDGEAGFRDAGRKHHLAFSVARWSERRVLRRSRQLAIQRQYLYRGIETGFLQRVLHAANLRRSRQKTQN